MTPTPQLRRAENLALIFQEVLTAVARLRANRQPVTDAESFRFQMREALKSATVAARNAGYADNDIKYATFAAVAFLDESILNSRNPIFADWPRKPLQEELFGTHMAGEVFFQYLQEILGRSDTQDLADLLEVFYLCLLLGFGGRYSVGNRGELRGIMDMTAAKLRRIRGGFAGFSPAWQLPQEAVRKSGDPWVRRLVFIAVTALVLAVLTFGGFKLSLSSGVADLGAMRSQSRS
jgi:type VI secretion system protein ImpK